MKKITLKNGLRVFLVPSEGTQAATVLVFIKVGSRYENKEINGAAHFIEHMMFKGTKRRPSNLDISQALDSVGAEYNAFTGKDQTGYYIKVDSKHLDLAVDLLHDMLTKSVFNKKEMDQERKVIIEEINMYNDNPMMHVEEVLETIMFPGNTLGWNIAGSVKKMQTMEREEVISFKESYYTPEQMIVTLSGKITQKDLQKIENTFGKMKSQKEKPKAFKKFTEKAAKQQFKAEYKKTDQMQLAIGFPSFSLNDKRLPALNLMTTILGGTMSSRLFVAVREKLGLAYYIRASISPYEDTGLLLIQAGLDKTRLPLAMKTILKEVGRLTDSGITAKELRAAKDNLRGRTLLKLEDSLNRAEWFARQELLRGEVKTLEQYMEELEEISAADIKKVAKEVLDVGKMKVAAIGPYKNDEEFIKKAGI